MSTGTSLLPIEVATPADLPSILDLLSTEYGYPYNSAAFWQWRYFQNPVAQVAIYVVRGETGEVAAMQPVSAYSMVVGGEVRRVHLFTGAITHSRYRRRGLFRRLIEQIVADLGQRGDFFIYTFPNELSVQGFQRFTGWQLRELLSLYVRPLFSLGWLQSGSAVSGKIDVAPTLSPERVGDLILSEVSHFEEDTHLLLQSAFLNRSVYVQRSRDYLEWRYPGNPTSTYFIQQVQCGDDLVGYVVVKASQLYGLRAGLVADLVASDNQVARALLKRTIRASRRRGLQVLAYLVGRFNPYRGALLRAGFLPLPRQGLPRRFYLYTHPGTATGGALGRTIEEMPWYVTWGDTDVV